MKMSETKTFEIEYWNNRIETDGVLANILSYYFVLLKLLCYFKLFNAA